MNPKPTDIFGPPMATIDRPPGTEPGATTPTVADSASAAKEQLKEATSTIKEGAMEALESAKQAGEDLFTTQKRNFVEKIEKYRSALTEARQSLDRDEVNMLVGPVDKATDILERAGRYLQNCDRGKFLRDAGDLARRKPEWVFGALFVAGLAGGRFLKAAAPKTPAAPARTSTPPVAPSAASSLPSYPSASPPATSPTTIPNPALP